MGRMTEYIVCADFTDRGTGPAQHALEKLERAHSQGALDLREARVISRDPNGHAEILGEVDHISGAAGFAVGSLVGALVGLVGGPRGALLGFTTGGLIGGGHDARRVVETNEGLEELTAEIPPASTVVVADVKETSTGAVREALGPGVSHYLAAAVRQEVEDILSKPQSCPNASDAPTGSATTGHEPGRFGEGERERASGRETHWWRR